jgi:outer membrane protein OmpA-like peptidoglycan-associated protein
MMRNRLLGLLLLVVCAALSLHAQSSPQIVKHKLGPNINGPRREIVPLISPDGSTLYFGREGYEVDAAIVEKELGPSPAQQAATKPQSVDPATLDLLRKAGMSEAEVQKFKAGAEEGRRQAADAAKNQPPPTGTVMGTASQHVWMSRRQADGSWGKAEYLMPPLNRAYYATAIYAALPDNNTLLVGGSFDDVGVVLDMFADLKKGTTSNTIAAMTSRSATGWSQPKYLKIDGFQTTAPRNDFLLAPDGKVLVLSIENAESVGKRDLYVSHLKQDGGWTKPKDLGAPVNSAFSEGGQFIAPDGVTMYFASDRPGGQGSYDIWVTRRLDDTWLKWSAPENLGPSINTPQAETFLSVDASGKLAFLASGKLMEEDIYEFALPEAARPKPVAFVRGKVRNQAGAPIGGGIAYERLADGTGAGVANASPADGAYQIALPLGEDYGFLASAPGYFSISEHIDLRAARANEVFERNLTLVPMKTREPIRLNNVFFKTNEAVLLPESRRELDRLARLLKENPAMVIEVAGHTDSQADDAFNQKLSEARAKAVVDYLLTAGIAAGRMQSKGYGETRPIAPNATEEGRAMNRRVEFTILKS